MKGPAVPVQNCSLLFGSELALICAAERTYPLIRKILKLYAGSDTAVCITYCRIIDITTHATYILHKCYLHKDLQ